MARIPVIAAALLASLVVALPASGAGGVSMRGVVVTVSANAVSVQAAKGIVTTCALTPRSPSLDGYATGDRVQVQCARTAGHLVLTRVRHLTSAPSTPPNDTTPVTFGGVITALSDASIGLHDGDRDLTCSIDATSPSTSVFTVGQHVKVACVGGVLTRIAGPATVPATSPTSTPHTTTTGALGTITAVSSASITVHTDGGLVTCTAGDGSPALGDYHVGDRVKMGCANGKLLAIGRVAAPPQPPAAPKPSATTTVGGTLTALSTTSLTVHNTEHGDFTCSLGASSPSLGDYQVGDQVGIACVDGTLAKIVKLH